MVVVGYSSEPKKSLSSWTCILMGRRKQRITETHGVSVADERTIEDKSGMVDGEFSILNRPEKVLPER